MNKSVLFGLVISLAGTALWIFGYLVPGKPSLIDWQSNTPWWIADYLPNLESEIGMVLAIVGTILVNWPRRSH
jgi:hypothetical protein